MMKKPMIYRAWILLIAVSLAAPLLLAEDEDVPPIVAQMRQINQNLRTLRGQFDQPSLKSQNIELVDAIRTHVKAAQQLEPLKTPQIPVDQRPAFLKDFRAELDKVLGTLDQLKGALQSGDTEAAKALLLKLNDLKREGHQEFKSPE